MIFMPHQSVYSIKVNYLVNPRASLHKEQRIMSYSLESCPYLGETKDCVMHGSTCVQKCAALHASECTSVSHCHVHNDSCVENCGSMDATRCNASGHCHLLNGSCAEKCEVT